MSLDPALVDAVAEEIREGLGFDRGVMDATIARAARHLLTSGLVLPVADVIPKQAVRDLAEEWQRDEEKAGPFRIVRAGDHCADELLALVAEEAQAFTDADVAGVTAKPWTITETYPSAGSSPLGSEYHRLARKEQ